MTCAICLHSNNVAPATPLPQEGRKRVIGVQYDSLDKSSLVMVIHGLGSFRGSLVSIP